MARSSAASRHMKATTAPRGVRHRTERHAPGSQQRRSQRTKGQGLTTARFGSPTGRIASGKRPRRERGVPRPGRPRITGAQDRHGASSKPQLVANVAQIEAPATATVHSGLVRADGTRRSRQQLEGQRSPPKAGTRAASPPSGADSALLETATMPSSPFVWRSISPAEATSRRPSVG